MNSSRPFVDWPEFDIGRPPVAPVSHSMADETVDITSLSFDEMESIQANIDGARNCIAYLLAAIGHHRQVEHMCGVTCVDQHITGVMDKLDLPSCKFVLLTLLKDLEYVDDDEEEPTQDDT
jgi:hypothetical protein